MKDNKFVIGISCIGSGVGQSVITSCRLSNLPLYTIGLGNNPYAFGMYECDQYLMTPSIYESNFIEKLISVCLINDVDVIIPGRDDEVMILVENQDILAHNGIKAILPGLSLIQLARDKEAMCKYFSSFTDSFVKIYQYEDLIRNDDLVEIDFPIIAKPRSGFASKGIKIIKNVDDLKDLDSDLILQELAIPISTDSNYREFIRNIEKGTNPQLSEISIQVVADKDGHILGRMASYNRLNNGVPIEILPFDDQNIWGVVDQIQPHLIGLGLKGPLNIQGRITKNGFKIFELNPRFTGITGLRAIMGFNEVEACIKSWLELPTHKLSINMNKFGVRQTTDKALDLNLNAQIRKQSYVINNNKTKIGKRENILISGATGFLGRHLIELLLNTNNIVTILTRQKNKAYQLYSIQELDIYDYQDIHNGKINLGHFDTLIHLGFERRQTAYQEISESLLNTNFLFNLAILHQVNAIINASSQSVYGTARQAFWSEDTIVSPETPYAQAKYSSELLVNNIKKQCPQASCTSIRLASLSGGNIIFDENELLYKLTAKVINNQEIIIQGGQQRFERLDVRDAAKAIIYLLDSPKTGWKNVYNIGMKKNYSLLELVSFVINSCKQFGINYKKELIFTDGCTNLSMGLANDLFIADTNWMPEYEIHEMIQSIILGYQDINHV